MELQIPEKLKPELQKFKNVLNEAEKICIISHRSPDGDAVGSNLALRLGLEQILGKEVCSACVDSVPEDSIWLKKGDEFVQDFNYEDFDAFISVDCGAEKLIVFNTKKPELLSGEKPFINIDHHISNENFGDINIVNPDDCSAGIIIYKIFRHFGWPISRDIATCILHGIYFDTGGMMHSNTTSEVLKVCGDLVSMGADLKKVAKKLFATTPVNKLRLWGRILERAYVNEEGVVVSAVNQEDYKATETDSKGTGGIIDYLNAVPNSKYCVLLSENEQGLVKGSLRTQREDVNLSEIAGKWGGGGHPKASGFGVEGKLKPVMTWQIIKENGAEAHGEKIEF